MPEPVTLNPADLHAPAGPEELEAWCEQNQAPIEAGRKRIVERAVVQAMACHPELRSRFVLTGSVVLALFHGLPRITGDVDLRWDGPTATKEQQRLILSNVRRMLNEHIDRFLPAGDEWKDHARQLLAIQLSQGAGVTTSERTVRLDLDGSNRLRVATPSGVAAMKIIATLRPVAIDNPRKHDLTDVAWMLENDLINVAELRGDLSRLASVRSTRRTPAELTDFQQRSVVASREASQQRWQPTSVTDGIEAVVQLTRLTGQLTREAEAFSASVA
ncbi:MAG: nucleotidyl transferase AbiEii/AbiGii toxin family protein [Planctomycetota bacterium]